MGLLIPISAAHVALAFTEHTTIHASADSGAAIFRHRERPEIRSVCGSDVHPYTVGVVGRPDMSVVMSWPPPPGRRCEDCCRLLGGTPRKPRDGWGAWEELTRANPQVGDG